MVLYRTSMQIVGDLLIATEQSGQDGIKTTSLLSKANLSYSRLSKFLSNLTGAGLINKIEFDGKMLLSLPQKEDNIWNLMRNLQTLPNPLV
jgi:predicted transcriptional regulator